MRRPAVVLLSVLGAAAVMTAVAGAPPDPPVEQVLFQIKLLELPSEQLRRLDIDFRQPQILKAGSDLNGLVETLGKNGPVRVLAEPKLVAVIGRPTFFSSGGELLLWRTGPDGKPVQRPEFYGTRFELVSRAVGDGDLRVELTLECSDVDAAKTIVVAGKANPAIRKRSVNTTLTMKFGEVVALSGLLQHADGGAAGDATATMLLISAEAVEPMAAVQPIGPLRRR